MILLASMEGSGYFECSDLKVFFKDGTCFLKDAFNFLFCFLF